MPLNQNTSFSASFTIIVDTPVIATQPSSTTVSSGGKATLSVVGALGTGSGLTYQWYSGTSPSTTTPIASATLASYTTPGLSSAASYWVRVTRNGVVSSPVANTPYTVIANSSTATVSIATAPAITTQPLSTTINTGETATLNVAASGSPSPTFQWYRGMVGDTTSPVATGSPFITPTLTSTTNYWVRATNTAGTANSTGASVTVITPPTITTQPVSTTVTSGGSASLSVAASGTAPAFQWYLGASGDTTNPVVGATSPSFTTPALMSTYSYWARASNTAGTSNSNSATVTVNDTFATWQNSQFNSTQLADPLVSGATADPDSDGITNMSEYVFGLSPLVSTPAPAPSLALTSGQFSVNFTAKAASGSGYTGATRHYALQSNDGLGSDLWTDVSGYSDISGSNQAVSYSAATTARGFYRLHVWLTP